MKQDKEQGGCPLVPWARIDDAFDDHPKVLAVLEHDQGGAAIGLWTLCLTWAHRNTLRRDKTPGLISASLPRRYLGPGARELAAILTKEGLWEPLGDGEGWMIHDFDKYLPTAKTSQSRSEAGRKGAASRWSAKAAANGTQSSGDGNLLSGDDNEPDACHDVDSNTVASDGSCAPARRAIPNGIAPETRDPNPEDQNLSTAAQKRRRGTRIPPDFTVSADMVAWARQRVPQVDGRTETEKFTYHFKSKPGRDAVKLDWELTWKNWMLNAAGRPGKPATQSLPPGVTPGQEHRLRT